MRELFLSKVDHELTQLDTPADLTHLDDDRLRGDVKIIDADTGALVAYQAKAPEPARRSLATIRRLLPKVRYEGLTSEGRMSTIRYAHRTFGFAARQPLRRREACSITRLEQTDPELHRAIFAFTGHVEEQYARLAPDAYTAHERNVDEVVLPDWRVNRGVFTSGIINDTAALPYHVDRNNLPGCWSVMLVVRRYMRGGYLHLPDYGVWFGCDDGHLLGFSGQDVLHGVTPFRYRTSPTRLAQPYRYSLVWYSVAKMKMCLPPEDELAWAQAHRTDREHERHDLDLVAHPEWAYPDA
jgi:hypothetical protein